MKKATSLLLYAVFLLFTVNLTSCVKDRDFPTEITPLPKDSIGKGTLLINEFCATGSTITNPDIPAANNCDWIELFNPSVTDTVLLEKDHWLFSDSILPGQADESILRADFRIAPRQYLLLYCDSYDTLGTVIHCAFNLSKSGEAIGIFYKNNDGQYITVDSHSFGPQTSGVTEGRLPDGGSSWNNLLNPTPGAPNF